MMEVVVGDHKRNLSAVVGVVVHSHVHARDYDQAHARDHAHVHVHVHVHVHDRAHDDADGEEVEEVDDLARIRIRIPDQWELVQEQRR